MNGSKTAKLSSALLAVLILTHSTQAACAQSAIENIDQTAGKTTVAQNADQTKAATKETQDNDQAKLRPSPAQEALQAGPKTDPGQDPNNDKTNHVPGPDALSQVTASAPLDPAESSANTQLFPSQILRTGINVGGSGISANTMQLANSVKLSPIILRIQGIKGRLDSLSPSAERNEARLDMLEAKEQATALISKTNLEIDFALAEMNAEQNVYSEILGTFTGDRDKLLTRVNAARFISNGILWAACEGLSIPSYNGNVVKNAKRCTKWSIPSGITGVLAGIVPSLASMYTLRAVNGKKKTSEVEPNMLAKIFNYPVSADIEYPGSVWTYLNQVPADEPKGKTRRDQLVDRWVSDANISSFTNRASKDQLDVLTASVAQKKGLSIATLSTRQAMLQQLSAEVLKMKRMLLELAMVLQGDKEFVAVKSNTNSTSKLPKRTPRTIHDDVASKTGAAHARNLTAQSTSYLGVP